ncbi:Stk1 family PASTA domain-containing Ser/Thr kinase [Nocardioides sp. GY 10113]|uniref:Stk1 family PASTA domain-containing Ser/Thr kinase n=1 Tax=Nocardioides sp. GY 10113 TaxID=2569761 RepID=UPI0010A9066D|nr:Stk1 family PASTA domain-containing Ser/Thr kinase [Nocardioides sp. GY 10113]TIC88664.1 Stk1 family PASTA domain-containing Ser/Thr kinase [Nocardioides sp. GY 10113]
MHEPQAGGADKPPVRDPNTGRVLDGRYRIGPRVARGGMASVYEATDLRLDRTVAIKIMHTGLGDATSGDEAFAARFVREARAAAGLSHPNVVAIYDQGQDADGTLYMAMELVPGHTLRDTITKESPMAPERALALLDPVLSALAAAHRAGLVHRDVKPENVLIADDGRIKVADFGLAKAVSADTQHTATQGVLIGTVSYLAPELVVDGLADARADVYAAGVMLFELLTGEKPHSGETPIQVAYRHVHHDVPAPSSLVPGLPAYVDALVARATTRDRTLRPADASVLLHHLRRVQAALREGLAEDPDLVADLMPSSRTAPAAESAAVASSTTPDALESLWDAEEAEALLGAAPPARTSRGGPAGTATDRTRSAGATATAVHPIARTPERTEVITPHGPGDAGTGAGRRGGRPARPRRRRRGLVTLVLLLLLAVAVGGGAYWYGWARYTTAPAVLGLKDAKAVTALEDAGLEVDHADAVHSDTVGAGKVISASPGAGSRILPGDTVTLVVSLGPEVHDVPDVAGMTVEEATEALADVKLVVGRIERRFSETVAEGVVLRTDPGFGSKKSKSLPVDTAVRLVVSKGRQPIAVRDWVGKEADAARDYWAGRGLEVQESGKEYSDDVPEGHIISQSPPGGTLFRGDTVSYTVSQGPELVRVPSVFYEPTEDAVRKLEALGLKVVTAHAAIYFNGSRAYSTDPGAGTMVRKGSTITVLVV